MIMRAWRGFADAAHSQDYPLYLFETVRPKLTELPGFRGLYLLRRTAGAEVEYQVLTLWDSVAAIHNFASPDLERAVVEPEAQAALLRYDATVRHFEVLAAPDAL